METVGVGQGINVQAAPERNNLIVSAYLQNCRDNKIWKMKRYI